VYKSQDGALEFPKPSIHIPPQSIPYDLAKRAFLIYPFPSFLHIIHIMTETIPSPRAYPIIGNLLDLQDEVPIHALERLTDIYGSIYQFTIGAHTQIVVGDYELFNELCDETRFWKVPQPQLAKGGNGARGLFASTSEKDEDWGQAHRILMPAFGPLAVEGMFDGIFPCRSTMEI